MAITPFDQIRQFDYNRGVPTSLLASLATPPSTAVAAETKANTLVKNGSNGTGPGTNTPRPASGSAYVTAGTNPAPKQNQQRDAMKDQADTAAVGGTPAPVVSAAAPTGTSPTASVVLSWAAVPGAMGYKVEKSVKSGANWGAWVAGVPPTGAAANSTQTGLSTGQVRFRVTATGGAKDSPASNPVSVTIP